MSRKKVVWPERVLRLETLVMKVYGAGAACDFQYHVVSAHSAHHILIKIAYAKLQTYISRCKPQALRDDCLVDECSLYHLKGLVRAIVSYIISSSEHCNDELDAMAFVPHALLSVSSLFRSSSSTLRMIMSHEKPISIASISSSCCSVTSLRAPNS